MSERDNLHLVARTLDAVLELLIQSGKSPAPALREFAQELLDYRRQLTVQQARLGKDREQLAASRIYQRGQELIAEIDSLQQAQHPVEAYELMNRSFNEVKDYYRCCKRIQALDDHRNYFRNCIEKTTERINQVQHAIASIAESVQDTKYAMAAADAQELLNPNRYASLVREVNDEINRIKDLAEARRQVDAMTPRLALPHFSNNDLKRDLDNLLAQLKP